MDDAPAAPPAAQPEPAPAAAPPAEPTAAPPATAPTAAPGATPPAPDATRDGRPDAAAQRQSTIRLQAKVAGVMLMLFGAFFAFQFAYGAAVASQRETWERQPGGSVLVSAPGDATVTVQYANGTTHSVAAPLPEAIPLAHAAARLAIATGNATYTRDVIVPAGGRLEVGIAPGDPAHATLGLDPTSFRFLWAVALLPALAAVGGFFAFRLRAPRIALAGAFVFLLGTAYLATFGGPDLLVRVLMLGTAGLSFWFIYRARHLFAPWRRPRMAA